MSNRRITTSLADVPVVTEPEKNSHEFPAKDSRVCDSDEKRFTDAFAAACANMKMPGKQLAAALGISEPHLSEMKNGTRAVTGPRIAGWVQTNKAFAISLMRELAKLTKNVSIVERKAVDKKKLRSQLILSLESNPAILDIVVAHASASLGIQAVEATEILNSDDTDDKEHTDE